ncbi:hypothetical protein T484DRAFT_1813130 [Baffinella frigidus]|nr:hypothetical protein T484DRAFT_1813130 [Cryptophyta sp. CCMP2293]
MQLGPRWIPSAKKGGAAPGAEEAQFRELRAALSLQEARFRELRAALSLQEAQFRELRDALSLQELNNWNLDIFKVRDISKGHALLSVLPFSLQS